MREAATQNVATSQSRAILTQIATSRDIVEKILAPQESLFPLEIRNLLPALDRLLLKPTHKNRKQAASEVERLCKYLEEMKICVEGQKVINDKLLTFRDWVDNWDDRSKDKVGVLEKIEECKEVMVRKLQEEFRQVTINLGLH
ncbi:hypothetical protein H0H93_009206 [Arthromyces matolae]|nr:hypothetical protein H0H93_009206 [Arthromyces matolae]